MDATSFEFILPCAFGAGWVGFNEGLGDKVVHAEPIGSITSAVVR